jgi:hypothetical protein
MTDNQKAGPVRSGPGQKAQDPMAQGDQPPQVPHRDPKTGELNFKIGLDIHLAGQALPMEVDCRDWQATLNWLRSVEFKRMRDQVEFVTLKNREVP